MTELQKQLSSIRKSRLEHSSLSKGQPSLFLTTSEASKVDIHTIHEAACSGLSVLVQYDCLFEKYYDSLLHTSSIDMQRELKTAEENRLLDAQLDQLLSALGLYAHEEATHLVLEYLIRRYRIHEMNADSLIKHMLIMHDTKIFARIIQLSKIEDSLWSFLQGVKASGAPLPRAMLVQRALKDNALLDALTAYTKASLDLSIRNSGESTAPVQRINARTTSDSAPLPTRRVHGANRILSFYTAVVFEMAQERPFEDQSMRSVYLHVLEGLKNSYPVDAASPLRDADSVVDQWTRSSCILLLQLSRKTSFGRPFVKVVSVALAEAFKKCASRCRSRSSATSGLLDDVSAEVLITMVVLSQRQLLKINSKLVNILSGAYDSPVDGDVLADLLEMLKVVQRAYDVQPFVCNLSQSLIHEVTEGSQQSITSRSGAVDYEQVSKCFRLLLASELLESSAVSNVLSRVFTFTKQHYHEDCFQSVKRYLIAVVQSISQRFAIEFEYVVREFSSSDAASSFLSECFSSSEGFRHRLAGADTGGLLLSLHSSIAAIRVQAMGMFAEYVSLEAAQTPDIKGLVQAACRNLRDMVPEVAVAAWIVPVLQRIAKHGSAGDVLVAFQEALSSWSKACLTSPSLSSTVIKSMLLVLRDESILRHIVQATLIEASPKALLVTAGLQWIVTCILPISLGSLAGPESNEDVRSLSIEALLVIQGLQCIRSDLWSNLSSLHVEECRRKLKAADDMEAVLRTLLVELLGPVLSTDVSAFALMEPVVKSAYEQTLTGGPSAVNTAQVVIRFLLGIVALLKDPSLQAKYLELLCPLMLISLGFLTNMTVEASSCNMKDFELFFQLSRRTGRHEQVASDLKALARTCSAPVPFWDIGSRVVVQLLSCGVEVAAHLLPAAFKSYCPSGCCAELLHIALVGRCSRSAHVVSAAHFAMRSGDSDVVTTVRVDSWTQLAALQAVSSYAAQMFSRKDAALKEADPLLVVSLLALVVSSVRHVDRVMREAGLLLASRISLLDRMYFQVPDTSITLTAQHLKSFCSSLVNHADLVVNDSRAADGICVAAETSSPLDRDLAIFFCWMAREVGWSLPVCSSNVVSLLRHPRVGLDTTWPYVAQLLDCAHAEAEDFVELVTALFSVVEAGYSAAGDTVQDDVVKHAIKWIAPTTDDGTAKTIRELSFALIGTDLFATASASVRCELFAALLKAQSGNHAGLGASLRAIEHVAVDIALPKRLLAEEVDRVCLVLRTSAGASHPSSEAPEDPDDASNHLSGLSVCVTRLVSVLEALLPVFARYTADDSVALSGVATMLLDLLSSLNQPGLRAVMLLDYCRAMLCDCAATALSTAEKSIILITGASVGSERSMAAVTKRRPKKGAIQAVVSDSPADADGLLSPERISAFVGMLLSHITTSKALQVQTSALRVLKLLLGLCPGTVMGSIETLGRLLSSSASVTSIQSGRDGLLDQLLRSFFSIVSSAPLSPDDVSGRKDPADGLPSREALPQFMLQSLCASFYSMPNHRRSSLLKLALSIVPESNTLCIIVNTLLVHCLAAYRATATTATTTADDHPEVTRILLSKAAQRRFNRELKAAAPEELFGLAAEETQSCAWRLQLQAVLSSVAMAHRLLVVAVPDLSDEGAGDGTTQAFGTSLNAEATLDYCHSVVIKNFSAAASSRRYVADMDMKSHELEREDRPMADNRRGNAATIAILHLEFAIEVLESKSFHRALVSASALEPLSDKAAAQDRFLSLADQVLQLLAAAQAAEQGLGVDTHSRSITVCVGDTDLVLSAFALGHHISSWCYKALTALQRLMDGPSFVAIMQELFEHEHMQVRQQALLILADRLEAMKSSVLKDDSESDLYIDLSIHLGHVLDQFLALLLNRCDSSDATLRPHFGLAQSSLMCIDILARFFGKHSHWSTCLESTLAHVLALSEELHRSITSSLDGRDETMKLEMCKLLGSSLLCTATLSSVLGLKALASLPVAMNHILSSLQLCADQLVSTSEEASAGSTLPSKKPRTTDLLMSGRTLSLLARSAVSSIGIIVADMSLFVHPYIPRILTVFLMFEEFRRSSISDNSLIVSDCDGCLTAIASAVPARLSMPQFSRSAADILAGGHRVAHRYCLLLTEVWRHMDRPAVVGQLGALTSLATLMLDYRRVYGDHSEQASEVDDAIGEAIVELCLKLTETELKSFLLRLAEWRDVVFRSGADDHDRWRTHARSVSYYSLVGCLVDKLKSLFIPFMGHLWEHAAEQLKLFHTLVTRRNVTNDRAVGEDGSPSSSSSKKTKKSKKRSLAEGIDGHTDAGLVASELREVTVLVGHILSSVRRCCVQDSTGFITEQRFEDMTPPLLSLLPLMQAFDSEGSYLTFCESRLVPALTALTVAVGKDLLWKPLNHSVLLLTRDDRKAVRMAAIKALHCLFKEAGEEYMVLLPECLPFLSELMEDASQEVVELTAETIRFIEELSGEKLDEYLQ